MDNLDNLSVWRQIPPEEKLILVSRAHGQGIVWAVTLIATTGIISIGLKMNWIWWGGVALSPLLFQFVTGKAWRDLRPRIILEYLAARSAARRYAFTANAKELNVVLLFRGTMEETIRILDEAEAYLSTAAQDADREQVWVALFSDAVVLMTEEPGGAQARFASVLDDKFRIESDNEDGRGTYSMKKTLFLSYHRGNSGERRVKLTSQFPAAMVVFENKVRQLQSFVIDRTEREKQAFQTVLDEKSDDFSPMSFDSDP